MAKAVQLVGFKVGREFFGAPITSVREIIRVPDITPVPDTPGFVEGVINLRGKIIPVIDMKKRLGAPTLERTRESRILVLEMDGKLVGLIVDSATEVLKVPQEAIEPPPEMISSIGAGYVTGVGKLEESLIVLLDLSMLLSSEEMRKVEVIHKEVTGLQEGKVRGELEGGVAREV